jgi:predicted nucleic acid-binding protein
MMIVVSNASPILNLLVVEQLDLLKQIYGRVSIPPATFSEIVAVAARKQVSPQPQIPGWIETKPIADQAFAVALQFELDVGEAEAIALALQLKADLLLLDERKARTVAERFGLKFIGLLGILILAKRRGLVRNVKPIVDDLIGKAGFWVGRNLYNRILREAGE